MAWSGRMVMWSAISPSVEIRLFGSWKWLQNGHGPWNIDTFLGRTCWRNSRVGSIIVSSSCLCRKCFECIWSCSWIGEMRGDSWSFVTWDVLLYVIAKPTSSQGRYSRRDASSLSSNEKDKDLDQRDFKWWGSKADCFRTQEYTRLHWSRIRNTIQAADYLY